MARYIRIYKPMFLGISLKILKILDILSLNENGVFFLNYFYLVCLNRYYKISKTEKKVLRC